MTNAMSEALATPKLAVLVSGPTEASVRRELMRHLKPNFHMHKNQWRSLFRDRYPLVVLSRALRQGQDPEGLYGPHAGASVLVLVCLDGGVPGSGFAATRDWCKAKGFNPVVWVPLDPAGPESETIDRLMELLNFVNKNCPWPLDGIEDLDDYLAKAKPLWC
ncbi:MAG: hypothetical protein CVU73_11465 [Deltaproteobacteria bacterium HGW-Deltaproteobacteria-8]|jgi:hypothetical protein|nr:MAG: hypothetical protein CVU73_11465 [Deltaproteobacteria bacterium HGW-Deltaproteobacteria-8]